MLHHERKIFNFATTIEEDIYYIVTIKILNAYRTLLL